MSFTSLAYYMDYAWMAEAYNRTRKDGASGIDNVTAEEYSVNLEENLKDLLDRAKSGRYRAPAVKRVYIPKGTSPTEKRPIGIPTFEDKILQRAVVMVLESIYEQDFIDGSYGFRPKRSAHKALQSIWKEIMRVGGGWVLEVDISKYFDTLKHKELRAFVKQRVCDGVLTKLVDKWLKAGVMESGNIRYPEDGTPQGGVISLLLSNIYLHEVLDKWFVQEIEPRLQGTAKLIRYADDFVILFANERDALRVRDVLTKRFGRYGLSINNDKTRLIDFRISRIGNVENEKFDFLGFTHYWGKSRKDRWVLKRKTSSKRLTRIIKATSQWCKNNRHDTLESQKKTLSRKLNGHYAYFGITGNSFGLRTTYEETKRAWFKWLNRRSRQKDLTWKRFNLILERYQLPKPRIVHSYVT
ncbi:MAG: group II intron reverse transcriptase/maturase [Fibrobacter sp.]|nr:group II intron reverse transcriptase/maturase [Fibrobacter sp.]